MQSPSKLANAGAHRQVDAGARRGCGAPELHERLG
jgi:hypothetical protein